MTFTFLIFGGCSNTISKKDAKNKLEDLLLMPISDSIIMSHYDANPTLGIDYTEEFVVQFQKKEFNEIFNKIKPKRFKNIKANIYGFTLEIKSDKNTERKSAIFNPENNTIKYTYNIE